MKVTGFIPPIPTPFVDGSLDLDSLKRLLDYLAGHVEGILIGGSVGEAANLTIDERIRIMQEAAAHVGDECVVAVSIADNALEYSRRLSEAAGDLGADLLVASCPNYYTADLSMLEAYFAALSEFASADLCLYDNPAASHTNLSVSAIQALARAAPRLTHVKVTDTALEKVEDLHTQTNLTVHAGDDVVLWHQLNRGAEGAMVALPIIYPERTERLWKAFSAGETAPAYQEYREMASFIHFSLGAPDYVSVIKAILYHRGVITSPEVRLPLVHLSSRRYEEIVMALGDGSV